MARIAPLSASISTTVPVVAPVLGPIEINIRMKPIPAKLGKTGVRWGTIALGLGAAVVGTYAIYKLMAPKEEEA